MADGMHKLERDNSVRKILSDEERSSYSKYKSLTMGDESFLRFLLYEVLTCLLGPLPGAMGIFLRRIVYPKFFRKCGKRIIIGRSCVFRHPSKISIGNNVTIDDLSLIDARGSNKEGVVLKDGVIINRNTMIQSKGGNIEFGKSVSIGANSFIVSWAGIEVGEGTIIAGGCYFSAGKFEYDDLNIRIQEQEMYSEGPIAVGKNVWIATRVTILDGVSVGDDAIISAGSFVSNDIPGRSVVHGNPGKVLFERR